jgi:two-component system, cell cycle sensor histidine kinase and response regulator CckA
LLANHRPTDPSFQDIMQIKQNANRAASLVRQLLAFSRRQTMRPEVLNLGDVLSDLSMLLKRLLGERVELDLRHGRDLWFVKADVNQFEQVVVNLAVNARDAMPDGGKVTIRTANVSAPEAAALNLQGLPSAELVMIEVSDTGTGIPPEVMDKIFEPFFTTKEVGKGTGLGLSTVFGIVKQSNGFIYVDSAVGQGTSFRVFLPRHIPTAEEEEIRAEPEVKKPATDLTGQGVILLVEDEDPVRAVNARALSARGYTVLEAASGVEALQIIHARHEPVDLVVSDVVMPEMDGPTLLGELRKLHPDLKVIFVSGYAEDAFRKNLPEGEEFNFLAKPFSLKQLVEAVKQAVAE